MRSVRILGTVCVVALLAIGLEVAALLAPRPTVAVQLVAPAPPVAAVAQAPPSSSVPSASLGGPALRLPEPIDTDAAAVPTGQPPVVMSRIRIPKIGLDAEVYEGVDLDTLSNGPGHWPGSAGPDEAGNMVVAGHRVTWSHPFMDLDRLGPGDQVEVGSARYTIDRVFTVEPDDVWITDPTPHPTLTLFACHPKFSAAQRIVVSAHIEARPA